MSVLGVYAPQTISPGAPQVTQAGNVYVPYWVSSKFTAEILKRELQNKRSNVSRMGSSSLQLEGKLAERLCFLHQQR